MSTPSKPTEPEPFAAGEDLILHLRILRSDTPGVIRIRQLLKGLLRRLRIKCVSIGPAATAAAKERGATGPPEAH